MSHKAFVIYWPNPDRQKLPTKVQHHGIKNTRINWTVEHVVRKASAFDSFL
jgi:hypothetical protein